MTRYLIWDVFTDRAFGGNPLAIIPDATKLAEGDLQRIASEFNLSETTFVFPPADPQNAAKVRIFTPKSELPFAGHPTIGTALALKELGHDETGMVLELGVGPIPVTFSGSTARFETRVPLETREGLTAERMAEMLNLPDEAISQRAHPPINASVGLEFLIAELTDTDALSTANPRISYFQEETFAGRMRLGTMVYVRRGQTLHARMFAPTGGIPEDPATGSASAALAALLGRLDGQSQRFEIHQGVDMGRPSLIGAEVTVENGAPVAVAISGQAVQVMDGQLTI